MEKTAKTVFQSRISLNEEKKILIESIYRVTWIDGEQKTEEFDFSREYPLKEISLEEINSLREEKKPIFLLKDNGRYFYTVIHRCMKFHTAEIIGCHWCFSRSYECVRLHALSDPEGCWKVRDLGTDKRIEKYPFIIKGYETIYTYEESFVVLECDHYKHEPIHKNPSIEKINAARLSLAQQYWPDVETLDEVSQRYNKEKAKRQNRLLNQKQTERR